MGDTVIVKKVRVLQAVKIAASSLEPIPLIDERYLTDALERVLITRGDNVMVSYFGGRLSFQISSMVPNVGSESAAIVTSKTISTIVEATEVTRGFPRVLYEDIGGIKDEIQKMREMIELPLRHQERIPRTK